MGPTTARINPSIVGVSAIVLISYLPVNLGITFPRRNAVFYWGCGLPTSHVCNSIWTLDE